MDRDQKASAIAERLNDKDFLNPFLISCVVIANQVEKLVEAGMMEYPTSLSSHGRNIAALCSEFDWQVEDEEIYRYCQESMKDVDKEERRKLFCVIKVSMMKGIKVA